MVPKLHTTDTKKSDMWFWSIAFGYFTAKILKFYFGNQIFSQLLYMFFHFHYIKKVHCRLLGPEKVGLDTITGKKENFTNGGHF